MILPSLSSSAWQVNGYASWATPSTVLFNLADYYRAASLVSKTAAPIHGTRISITVDASALPADGFFVGFLNDTDYTTVGSTGSDMGQRPEDATGVAFNVYGTDGIRGRRASAVETSQVDTLVSTAATWTLDFSLSGTTVTVAVARDASFISTLTVTGVTYDEGLVYISGGTGTGGGGVVSISSVEVSVASPVDGLKVEVGLGSTPRTALASVSWTDVTSDVLLREGVTFNRGRSSQDDTPSPGRLSFTLDNERHADDRTNLIKYPSAESGATGWNVSGCTVAQSSAWSASGTYCYALTCTTPGTIFAITANAYKAAVTAGLTYTGSLTVRSATAARSATLKFQWLNAADGVISYSNGTTVATSTSADTRISVTATAPVGATGVNVFPDIAGCSASEVHYFDAAMIEAVPAGTTTPGTYFDGSMTGYEWTGTPHASTSQTIASARRGRWTVGGSNCMSGWDVRVPVRVRHTTHGVLWLGYVDATSAGWDGGVRPLVRVEASDRLARFARIKMVEGLIRAEQEYDEPVISWSLDEEPTAESFVDRAGRPVTLAVAQVGTGGSLAMGVTYGPDDKSRPVLTRVDSANGKYLLGVFASTPWSTTMTIEAWLSPGTSTDPYIVDEFLYNGFLTVGDTAGEQLSIHTHGSGGIVAVLGNPTYSVNRGTVEYDTNYHFAVTLSYSAGTVTMEFFVNGVSQGTTSRTMAMPTGRVEVGRSAYIAAPMSGAIGPVVAYDEVLSAARILEHYRAGSFYPESPYERVQRLARLAGVASADVAASGSSTYPKPTMGKQPAEGASFLDACHAAAAVEDGVFFLDRTGVLRFHRRGVRLGAAVGLTLAPTDVDCDVSLQTDTDRVLNDVTVSRVGGATYRKVNSTSATDYDTQDATVSLACGSDVQAFDRVEWIVYERGTPEPRIDSVSVDLVTRAATVDVGDALTADVSTRVQLTSMPTPDSPSATVDLFVEGISDTITHDMWLRTFATSSATARSNVFTLDDATLGDLDTGGVLA